MGRMKEITVDEYKAAVRSRWTEAEFTREVIVLAQSHGFLAAHFLPAMNRRGQWRTAVQGDGKGFPDLVLLHPGRGCILVCELKVGKNKPTAEQTSWLEAFRAADVAAYVWRPCDWPEIEQMLKGDFA